MIQGPRDDCSPDEFDVLTVGEVSGRFGNLSTEELRVVRDYEERTKNRDTTLEQLDRRIRTIS